MAQDPKAKVRDCSDYMDEYKACTSLSNKIHTYYTFGYYQKKENCVHWKEMWELCDKATRGNDAAARQALLTEEKQKADEIIKNRASVWTYRKEPPIMWFFPGKKKEDISSLK